MPLEPQTYSQPQALTLLELQQTVARLVVQPATQNVWVVAETSDLRVVGGHCYMELLQKDPATGKPAAKCRAVIWSSNYRRIDYDFFSATGQHLASGMKVMLQVSAMFSPIYDYSLAITAVNPEYTLGDLLRRRRESIERLRREGILDANRELKWPRVPQRIAVISAKGAAGYGDFMNQLYHNPYRLRFTTKLFEAIMQGTSAPASIISALEQVAQESDRWDGVVLIRGGGATSDLQCFEDYTLAENIAQFPLPVAIGLGHERDITLLDYVANLRLKTPTAVAEWLIGCGADMLGYLAQAANNIAHTVTSRLTGNKEQLAQAYTLLPVAARAAVERNLNRLQSASVAIGNISTRRIQPSLLSLDNTAEKLRLAIANSLKRHSDRLDSKQALLTALSPDATLRRGYSITRINGHAVTDASTLAPGDIIETTFANGSSTSCIQQISNQTDK